MTVLALMVKEPKHPVQEGTVDADGKPVTNSQPLGRGFWYYMLVLLVFTLGNSSDVFLMLRAQAVHVPLCVIFLVLGGSSLVTSWISTPAGKLSDKIGRKTVIVAGWLVYAAVYLGFALEARIGWLMGLFIVYGVYYGLTEGVTSALVADLVPREKREMAYGWFGAATGVMALPASIIAGVLFNYQFTGSHWERVAQGTSGNMPFLLGAVLAGLAAVLMLFLPTRKRQ